MTDPAFLPDKVLISRERAYQERHDRVDARVTEILTKPDKLQVIVEDYAIPLSQLLVGVCGEDPYYGAHELVTWLQGLALRIAEDEIPESDDESDG